MQEIFPGDSEGEARKKTVLAKCYKKWEGEAML